MPLVKDMNHDEASDHLPPGNKFASIALVNVSCDGDQPIHLNGGLSVHFSLPFSLDEQWRRWLGTIRVEELARSNFMILAISPSTRPNILDDENKTLKGIVSGLLYSILMHGVPYNEGGLIMTGANVDGKIEVREVGTLEDYFPPPGVHPPFRLERGVIMGAVRVANGLRAVHIADPDSFLRFKRGLAAWHRAVREERGEDRLHQFVRAIEALIKPQIAKTTNQFIHRCQTFARPSRQTADLLKDIYGLRSYAEHLNEWEPLFAHVPKRGREHRALLRAYQAEILAGRTYCRILSDSVMLENFRTDAFIEAFWKLSDAERRRQWGNPLDLQTPTVTNRVMVPPFPPGVP